jgi:hypothetical protein
MTCDVPSAAVTALINGKCIKCHGVPPLNATVPSLVTRTQLLTKAPAPNTTQTFADRSLERMKTPNSPMPPLPPQLNPPATAREIAALAAWIAAGTPAGACSVGNDGGVNPIPDAGMNPKPDAGVGPQPTTCASNKFWPANQTMNGNRNMNPGLACKACHGPPLNNGPDFDFGFMGTLFPSLHEKNFCNAPPPAGAVVEILDMNDKVQVTMTVNPVGNFYNNSKATAPSPYKAQVRVGNKVIAMKGPQTNGDCNSCHTEQGTMGAPGRVVTP